MNTRKFDFQLAIKRWVVFTVEKFPPPEPTAFDPTFLSANSRQLGFAIQKNRSDQFQRLDPRAA